MNPIKTLLRAALAVALGAITFAGCATNRNDADRAGKTQSEEIMLDRQVNLTHLHPDTHPERRVGLDMAFPTSPKSNPRPEEYSNAVPQPEL